MFSSTKLDQKDLEFIQKCYSDFREKQSYYNVINRYYYGNTDTLSNFTPQAGRSNLQVRTNFIQKLVDEEAEYSFGNDITYVARVKSNNMIEDIYRNNNNKADYDINLGTELIKYGLVYEISYLEKDHNNVYRFKNKTVTPLEGYMYLEEEKPVMFIRTFKKQLDNTTYIDVYTDKFIYHLNENFEEVAATTTHYFGIVPVGVGMIGGKQYSNARGYIEGDKTIFRTIKNLQDAYETNFSDVVSEISDFRNAILKMYGIEAENEVDKDGNEVIDTLTGKPKKKAPVVRNNCIMLFGDRTSQDAEWLIKNVNDTFIKNTRDDIQELIYALTSHVNTNEKMVSNLSGIALRSRLQTLEAKCKKNEKAMLNIINTRLTCLFTYLYQVESKNYDIKDVKVQFTPNVPVDETNIAQIITQIPHEVVSNETKRSWLPRIENVEIEAEKIKKEMEELEPKLDLDGIGHGPVEGDMVD